MSIESSQDLHDLLLSGERVEPSHIDALVRRKIGEDTRLDYKHGRWLQRPPPGTPPPVPGKPTDPAAKVRKYVAGFANGEGGVLVIGVDAESPTWSVTGCTPLGGRGPLGDWCARALDEIGVLISPPPTVRVVNHPDGEVLLVAVRRSSYLVPCLESKERVFYVRLFDSTKSVPSYLVHDLLLGRRAHANLVAHLEKVEVHRPDSLGTGALVAFIGLHNSSLVWARNIVCGIVGLAAPGGFGVGRRVTQDLPPDFRTRIRITPTSTHPHTEVHVTGFTMGTQRTQGQTNTVDLAPFETGTFNLGLRLPPTPARMRWRGAIYFVADGGPAAWFEVSCRYDVSTGSAKEPKLMRVLDFERARVSVRALPHSV